MATQENLGRFRPMYNCILNPENLPAIKLIRKIIAWLTSKYMLRPVTVSLTNFVATRYPMSYTLGQAAKATGVSKMTLSRAVKKGIISATKNEVGAYLIEPSELHRVFPPVSEKPSHDTEDVATRYTSDTALLHRVKELEIRLEVSQEQLEETREDRDNWREQAQRLLLTHQKPVESANAVLATSLPEKPFRLSGGQFFGLAACFILVVMLVAFLPEIRARFTAAGSPPPANAGIQQPAVTIQPPQ